MTQNPSTKCEWEERFDKEFDFSNPYELDEDEIKSFIRQVEAAAEKRGREDALNSVRQLTDEEATALLNSLEK